MTDHVPSGAKGNRQQTPIEEPNTLRAKTIVRTLHLLSGGPVKGLVDGGKSIYLNNVPLVAPDGTANFFGVTWTFRDGGPGQSHIPGFKSQETYVPLMVPVTVGAGPVVRSLDCSLADRFKVIMRVNSLLSINPDNGDQRGTSVEFKIERRKAGTTPWTNLGTFTITGKCVTPYARAYVFPVPVAERGMMEIRLTRVTPDSTSSNLQNGLYWEAAVAVVDRKMIYPGCALLALEFDAEQFGSELPQITVEMEGYLCQVPMNYDPVTRTYATSGPGTSGGIWDGTFKSAYTNNPAWICYTLLVNEQDGLGSEISPSHVDKWSFYAIAKYCDEMVPDGYGGYEPRYTMNGVISRRDEAYRMLQAIASSFRGMIYWGSGSIVPVADRPTNPVKLVTPANVIGGQFQYEGVSYRSRHSVVRVRWMNPALGYREDFEVVKDNDLIREIGVKETDFEAIGCTSRGLAHRLGRWVLETEKTGSDIVRYNAGLDHADVSPGDVILIQDPSIAGRSWSGRIRATGRALNPNGNVVGNPNATGGTGGQDAAGSPPTSWSIDTTPNGLSRTLQYGTDTDSGLSYIDIRYQGTPYGSSPSVWVIFHNPQSISVVQGETWYASVFAELVAGKSENVSVALGWLERNGSAVLSESTSLVALPSAGNLDYNVISHSAVIGSAGANNMAPGIKISFLQNKPVDFTVRLALPAVKKGQMPERSFGAPVSFSSVALDRDIDLSVSESTRIRLVLKNGLLTDPITITNTPPATTRWLTLEPSTWTYTTTGSPQPVTSDLLPDPGSVWVAQSNILEPVPYRVLSVTEDGESGIFSVVATRHSNEKFGKIENNLVVDDINYTIYYGLADTLAAPSSLAVKETIVGTGYNARVNVTFSWRHPSDPRISYFEVEVRDNADVLVRAVSTRAVSVDLPNMPAGTYKFKVRSVGDGWRKSVWSELPNTTLSSTNVVPDNVLGFRSNVVGNTLRLLWNQVPQHEYCTYEIRYTPSFSDVKWQSALEVVPPVEGTFVDIPRQNGTYLIKAKTVFGVYSQHAATVQVTAYGVDLTNVVETLTQHPTWSGTKTDLMVEGPLLVLRYRGDEELRNVTWSGVVAGTPGTVPTYHSYAGSANGLTRQIVGTGYEDGYFYIDVRYYGTPTSAFYTLYFETSTYVVAQVNDEFVFSMRARILPGGYGYDVGSGGRGLGLYLYNASGVFQTQRYANIIPGTGPLSQQKYTHALKITESSWQRIMPGFRFRPTVGSYIDFTLRMAEISMRKVLPSVPTSGTYVFSSPDLSQPYVCRLTGSVKASGRLKTDVMSSWNPLSVANPLSGGGSDAWDASLEYRATQDNPSGSPTWGPWKPLQLEDALGRAFQFRLTLSSLDNATTIPEASECVVTIDMPDRVEGKQAVSVPAAGLTVTYDAEFAAIPAVAVTGVDLQSGDRIEITNKTKAGFTIKVYNSSGTAVARVVDWIAKGYGRKV